jgi:uncharacterized membrane protein
MTRKNTLTKKEKLYILSGAVLVIIILGILVIVAYNNLFGNSNTSKGTIEMSLADQNIITNDNTTLKVIIKNTGKTVLEGKLSITPDDTEAVKITHQDLDVLNIKLYPQESVTRILQVTGKTKAIRTDYKIFATITHENETISTNEIVLTVTQE